MILAAVLYLLLNVQPVRLRDFNQHQPIHGVEGDFAIVVASRRLVRLRQRNAHDRQRLFLLRLDLTVLVHIVEAVALLNVHRRLVAVHRPVQHMDVFAVALLELLLERCENV